MGQLAARLHLSISTMTRITGQLIAKELAERWADDKDRRGCWVALSSKGKALHAVIKKEILARESLFLEKISAPTRQALIEGLVDLSRAVDDWRAATSAEPPGRRGSGLE
jgi:DNA-binding MarR family transcriptional regulator